MEDEQEKIAELEAEDIDSLKKALEEEKAKAEKYLSNWQRAEADFDNYRKRIEQERSETDRFANTVLILNLLPVLDDLERAFNSLSAKLAQLTWIDGIRLIYRKLQAILETRGLTEIKTVGENFDPTVHEAVSQGEGEEGKVIEELQKGYKLHDRVIRPALVVVGKGKKEKKEEEKPEESVD
jgi:molecular chaperone GrpE